MLNEQNISEENVVNAINVEELCEVTPEAIEHNSEFMREYIIDMDISNLSENTKYDLNAFQKGIKSVSEMCGKITALVNCGITPDMAFSYITGLEFENMKNKTVTETMKMQCHADIEKAKYGEVFCERNTI